MDVRHEAAHSALPTMPVLRLAVASAFAWLQGTYWAQQEQHLQEYQAKMKALLLVCGPTAYVSGMGAMS